jgi:hypothetical protein
MPCKLELGLSLEILTTYDPFIQTGPFGWALRDLFCINNFHYISNLILKDLEKKLKLLFICE